MSAKTNFLLNQDILWIYDPDEPQPEPTLRKNVSERSLWNKIKKVMRRK